METTTINRVGDNFYSEFEWVQLAVKIGAHLITWTEASSGLIGDFPDTLVSGIIENRTFESNAGPGEWTIQIVQRSPLPDLPDIRLLAHWQYRFGQDYIAGSREGEVVAPVGTNWISEGF